MLQEYFDYEKAKETLLYIANRLHGKDNDTYHVVKAIYFADKLQLTEHGHTICGDDHVAMDFGPVPSTVYDILKTVRGKSIAFRDDPELPEILTTFDNGTKYEGFRPLRNADLDFFSKSNIRNLDTAIDMVKGKSFQELVDMTHSERAWQMAWEKAEQHGSRSELIDRRELLMSLPEGEEMLEYMEA